MSKIKVFALGGLGENGKNMYCVEVDNEILVFDVGFKYPDETMYGIDTVVPEFTYLKESRKKIKGLFLSHGHVDNIGAVNDFVRIFPEVPIYASNTTMFIVEHILEESGLESDNLNKIAKFDNVSFKNCSVFALPLTHSLPENFGYAINTKQGIIFYATDYIFDHSAREIYSTDIGKLAYLGKQGVLCMLGESLQAAKIGHTSPNHRVGDALLDFFEDAGKRAYIMVYSSNVSRIQEILDESTSVGRKVAIYGRRLTDIVNFCIDSGVISFDKKNLVTIFNVNKFEGELTIIVSGERDRPFSGMKRIVSGRDKYLTLTKDDSVLIAARPVPNTEIEATAVTNDIFRSGANVTIVNKKVVRGNHASKEDVLLMLNLLDPKYYVPIKGEYRHQIANRNAALSKGFPKDNIILVDNGQVLEFENKELTKISKIPVGEMLVDGHTISEGEVVLKDRELLKENGIVIVSCALNFDKKKIIAGPEIVTRGFIYIKENKEYIEELKSVSREIIEEMLQNSAQYNDVQKAIREGVSKYIYDEKGRKPMIITMIQTL